MTQEEKDLLLKDICSRVSNGGYVKVSVESMVGFGKDCVIVDIHNLSNFVETTDFILENVKAYLRPMSSITEEEVQEIRDRLNNTSIGRTITKENFEKCCDFLWFTKMSPFECVSEKMMDVVIGYLDENMFDHRGLIEKGLAIKSPKNVVYLYQEK